MSIRVAIVEDEGSVRENLARLIDSAQGFSCVGKFSTAEDALRFLPKLLPDVALMDINLPGLSGIECVRKLKQKLPTTQFLMLTIEEDGQRVFESLQTGATGYLVKNLPRDKILEAVADVHRGGSPISSHIARLIVRSFQRSRPTPEPETDLTLRESEILSLLARGYRSKEIGDELRISATTVNTHVRNVYEKLHVRSRAEAVARFLNPGSR